RWTPGGAGDPYLRIVTDDFTRVYKLEDDGEYELDYDALGLGPAERPDLAVGRWSVEEVDVNGNTLTMVGMTEQPCGTQICDNFPDVVINGSSSGAGLGTSPSFLGVGYQALIYDSQLEDFQFSGDDLSAALIFTVYDASERPLCNVSYDASNNAIVQYPTENGLALWKAWSIDLGNGGGASTCGRVDPSVFGSEDMRDYIESFSWGFGIGEMSPELTTQLSLTFGPDWPLLQPLLHAVYVTNDGVTATEMGFGRNADLNGCYTGNPTLEPDELVPSGPNLPDSLYAGTPYYFYDIQP
ncbi:MAG: hypothetical protein H0V89_00980, partial [Deltaproteobacteria bacterium]|nr:hypothetical protein [Deltaproteobacteria bacterium]